MVKPEGDSPQHQPLTVALRNICRDYPAGGGILRELLQNADDAGASHVKFVLDEASYPTDELFPPQLADYQGPALLAYNSGVFTENDFNSLLRIGDSLKLNDGSTTGKFGRGFNSVYSWTDLPSIVSGRRLQVFEPHKRFSGGGPFWDFVKDAEDASIKNQMAAFSKIMNDFDHPFQGTIIRIPLRNYAQPKSKILEKEVTFSDVAEVMNKFMSSFGKSGLLFMRSIESITIMIGEDSSTVMEVANSNDVRIKKTNLNDMIKKASEGELEIFDLSFNIDVETRKSGKIDRTSFVVHHTIGDYPEDKILRDWSKSQAFLPWVAVATQNLTNPAGGNCGSFFTVLPLPIGTNQPAHIHGLFSLSPDRARLHRNSDSSLQDKLPAQWNKWLFDALIPKAWVRMLLYSREQYPNQSSYRNWPRVTENSSDECYDLTRKVVNIIEQQNCKLWYTSIGFMDSGHALFGSGHESESQAAAFHDVGIPVIQLTGNLRDAVQKMCKSKPLDPINLCDFLKAKGKEIRAAGEGTKQLLLDYVLSGLSGPPGLQFGHFKSLQLFPFEDESYKSTENIIAFVHRDAKECELFSRAKGQNIDLQRVSSETKRILQSCGSQGLLDPWIKFRSARDLKSYCLKTYFKNCDESQDIVSLDEADRVFVCKVWDWILARGYNILDESISYLWLIPLSNGQYRRLKPKRSVHETIYAPAGEVGDFLRKLSSSSTERKSIILSSEQTKIPSKALKLLTDASKINPVLCIKSGDTMEDFVIWLSGIDRVVEMIPDKDKFHLQTLLVSRLYQCEKKPAIKNALRRLKIFQRISWRSDKGKLLSSLFWTNIDERSQVAALLDGVPVPNIPQISFLDASSENSKRLIEYFELADLLSTTETLQRLIILWEVKALDSWDFDCKQEVSDLLLQHYQSLEYNYRQRIKTLAMVPIQTTSGKIVANFATATELIDPSSDDLRGLFFDHEQVYPAKMVCERKGSLIELGMKQSLDRELVEGRVKCFAENALELDDTWNRARKLLQMTSSWIAKISDSQLSILRDMLWLPAVDQRGAKILTSADKCRGLEYKLLTGLVYPVLNFSISEDWQRVLGWQKPLSQEILLSQLEQGIKRESREIIDAVLSYVDKHGQLDSLVDKLGTLSCVLSSVGKLVTAEKAFRSECTKLQPYLYNVESRFWRKHSTLLKKIGVKEKPSLQSILKIQDQFPSDNTLNVNDEIVAIEIARLASNHPRGEISSLKILNKDGRLSPIHDVTFDDMGGLFKVKGNFILVHRDLPRAVIEKLQIEPLSQRVTRGELDINDDDDEEEYNQCESVVSSISSTLERYPPETTFKEYLANADDSEGATQINWLLDQRRHPEESLVTKELRYSQGKALLVHNDGTFSPKDFDGFKKVGQGAKRDDPTKIGKYGRGAQTMYHWTDVPMVLSGKYLVILDPLQNVLPLNFRMGRRKPGLKIELSKLRSTCPDQLIPFEGLWGFSSTMDSYSGTIFRFPLRPHFAESKLSENRKCLGEEEAISYMESFFEEARICLLFLKNIRSIDFTVYGDKEPRWSVKSSRDGVDGSFSDWIVCTNEKCSKLPGSASFANATAVDQWWVAAHQPQEVPTEINYHYKRTMKNVECGMAALVESKSSDTSILPNLVKEPKIFSTLPLRFRSNLPVNIHATFLITGDRQSIPIEKSMDAAGASFNRWLLDSAIPKLYLAFLEDLGKKIGRDVFRFWPIDDPIQGSLEELICQSFWQKLPREEKSPQRLYQVFPSEMRCKPPILLDTTDAIFEFFEKDVSKTLSVLLEFLFPKTLVRVPFQIQSRLPNAISVTAQILRKRFKQHEDASQFLENSASPELLTTLLDIMKPLGEADHDELDGCRILPLANGKLGTVRTPNPFLSINLMQQYYLADQHEVELFSFATDLLITSNPAQSFKESLMKKDSFNLRHLRVSDFGTLLKLGRFSVDAIGADIDIWLKKFWKLCRKKADIGDNALKMGLQGHQVHVAFRDGTRIYLTPEQFDEFPSVVINPSNTLHWNICEKIPGIYIFDPEFMPTCIRLDESSLRKPNSFNRLVRALSELALKQKLNLDDFLKWNFNDADLKTFLELTINFLNLDSGFPNGELLSILKQLPLFPAISPPGSWICAKIALSAESHYLLVPWMSEYSRFIDPSRSDPKQHPHLTKLQVRTVNDVDLLLTYVLPSLPRRLDASNTVYFQQMIREIAQNGKLIYSSHLRGKRLAPDGHQILRSTDELFDHEDPIFVSTFRNETNDRFLLDSLKCYRSLWVQTGLRQRVKGQFRVVDYILCLQIMRQRLEICKTRPADLGLLKDVETVLGPLVSATHTVADFRDSDWLIVAKDAVFPALEIMDNQPEYRQEAMTLVAVSMPTLSLAEAIRHRNISVCWSQVSFPRYEPASWTFDKLPTRGNPSATTVWRHLLHLKELAARLTRTQVTDFLSDLYRTYDYLQDNLEESRETFSFQKHKLWLNLDVAYPDQDCLEDLKSSWSSIEYLVLLSSCDSPPLMMVKQSLARYDKLLRKLGCRDLIRLPIQLPPMAPTNSLSGSLNVLRREGKLVDVTLVSEGKEIRAHKVVLIASSDYFRRQFSGPWSDEDIKLDLILFSTLSIIIDFLYTDKFDWKNLLVDDNDGPREIADKLDCLLALCHGADYLQIQTLHVQAQNQILGQFNMFVRPDNVIPVRDLAAMYKACALEAACNEFYQRNKDLVEFASRDSQSGADGIHT